MIPSVGFTLSRAAQACVRRAHGLEVVELFPGSDVVSVAKNDALAWKVLSPGLLSFEISVENATGTSLHASALALTTTATQFRFVQHASPRAPLCCEGWTTPITDPPAFDLMLMNASNLDVYRSQKGEITLKGCGCQALPRRSSALPARTHALRRQPILLQATFVDCAARSLSLARLAVRGRVVRAARSFPAGGSSSLLLRCPSHFLTLDPSSAHGVAPQLARQNKQVSGAGQQRGVGL